MSDRREYGKPETWPQNRVTDEHVCTDYPCACWAISEDRPSWWPPVMVSLVMVLLIVVAVAT